ncbi:hypothetical protein B8W67_19820 [Mycolicibacillus koreensis]|uniref:PE-PGRS family protein n=2 Tax=Mycolicibacillus koreensis TaxID=1069220 RepID=A0AA91PC01_9MYCO|nr:hypothetical protein B8W67_19820 [Mycolicibacillus koreensis]
MPAIQLTASPLDSITDLLGGATAALGALGDGLLNADTFGDPLNPLEVYPALFENSFNNLSVIGQNWLDQPFPILQAVASNQFDYIQGVFNEPASIIDVPGKMLGNLENVFAALTTLTPTIGVDSPLGDAIAEILEKGLAFWVLHPEALFNAIGALPGTDLLAVDVDLPPAMVMGLAGLGPLVNTLAGIGVSGEAFQAALNSGEYLSALGALVAGPGFVGDAALNGQWGLDILGLEIPVLNGLLQPMESLELGIPGILSLDIGPMGGLTDGMINYLPGVIADALGGQTIFDGLGLGSSFDDLFNFLNPATLLDALNLGDLSTGIGALLPDALPFDMIWQMIIDTFSSVI